MLSHGHNNNVGNQKLICFPDKVKAGANLARAALDTSAYDKNDRVALAVIKGMREMFVQMKATSHTICCSLC